MAKYVSIYILFFLYCFVYTVNANHEKISYEGYSLYRVFPETREQLATLRSLSETSNELDFWTSPSRLNSAVDIMVAPSETKSFKNTLRSNNLKYSIQTNNLQKLIRREEQQTLTKERKTFGWKSYHTLDEIYEWLDYLVETYPEIVSPIVGGRTYENRTIRGVKLSHNKPGNIGVFVEGGIHAREWISPATVTFILNQLLTSEDSNVKYIAENYDWYIFPSVNPDGYVYSHTVNRLWRKSRSKGNVCDGVDLNRNFDNYWNQGGASTHECSDAYAGTGPFSEIETKTLSEYVTSISDHVKYYLDFHAYSQLLMIPYGHDYEVLENYDIQKKVGDLAAESLAQRYGTKYEVGSILDVIYKVTGASLDWASSTLKIPFAYVWELRDTGRYGFLLPARLIRPTALETLDSLVTILKESRQYVVDEGEEENSEEAEDEDENRVEDEYENRVEDEDENREEDEDDNRVEDEDENRVENDKNIYRH